MVEDVVVCYGWYVVFEDVQVCFVDGGVFDLYDCVCWCQDFWVGYFFLGFLIGIVEYECFYDFFFEEF